MNNIGYMVNIYDDYGAVHTVDYFTDVELAIEIAREVDKNLISVLQSHVGLDGIDQYHLNNPHKRFEVILEVNYECLD